MLLFHSHNSGFQEERLLLFAVFFPGGDVLHCISRAHGQPMDSCGRSNALLLKALQLACEEGRALRYCHSFEPCIIKRF